MMRSQIGPTNRAKVARRDEAVVLAMTSPMSTMARSDPTRARRPRRGGLGVRAR